MSYRRRVYRSKKVRQNPKYSGFFSSGVHPVHSPNVNVGYSGCVLVRNLSNQGSFAPPIQKIKHVKCSIHIPRITQNFSTFDIDFYMVYIPQGSFNLHTAIEFNQNYQLDVADTINPQLGNVILNHPEWIMARGTASPSLSQQTKVSLNSRVNRNLNTGDMIVIISSCKNNAHDADFQIWGDVRILPTNIYYSYYSRSN